MADISLCVDNACPSRHQCFRYEAKHPAGPARQSYADFGTLRAGRDRCEQFISAERHWMHLKSDSLPVSGAPGEEP